MPRANEKRIWISMSDQLEEGHYIRIEVTYTGSPASVLVFRYQGKCLAYRNLCVHMPRELDCEKDTIFDDTGQFLRCSMHGIVYDPITGESMSTMCTGERLTPVRVLEDEDGIWIQDKQVKNIMTRKE